jgi:hypothetical protein
MGRSTAVVVVTGTFNTQLFNTLDDVNRFKIGAAAGAPWNARPPGTTPSMDGFVTDSISNFTGEIGRQPTYHDYAQIMTGYTPEQLPVLNGIARDFGVFDHWFCEVPSQTFMNRRHTSLIATLRKTWGLGDAFTQRDAPARTFEHIFALDAPRDPKTWTEVTARPVPDWTMDPEVVGQTLSTLGKGMGPALIDKAKEMGVKLPTELDGPSAKLTPELVVPFLRDVAGHFFPLLAHDTSHA